MAARLVRAVAPDREVRVVRERGEQVERPARIGLRHLRAIAPRERAPFAVGLRAAGRASAVPRSARGSGTRRRRSFALTSAVFGTPRGGRRTVPIRRALSSVSLAAELHDSHDHGTTSEAQVSPSLPRYAKCRLRASSSCRDSRGTPSRCSSTERPEARRSTTVPTRDDDLPRRFVSLEIRELTSAIVAALSTADPWSHVLDSRHLGSAVATR